jgi:hypothetical protein
VTATNQQIITDAFTLIGVVADGKQPTPTQSNTAIYVFNNNMLTQQRDGWRLGWYPQGVSNLNSNAPLRDEDISDVTLCLAAWLSARYGITIEADPDPQNEASLYNQIKNAFIRLTKRSLRYTECDLGELSRPQGGPWGGPNWL